MMSFKDSVYAQVAGTVARIFMTKNGAAFEMEVKREGREWGDSFTVWGLGDQVSEGDRVKVKGWYQDRRDTFTKRDGTEGWSIKRAVNAPELVERVPAAPASAEDVNAPF